MNLLRRPLPLWVVLVALLLGCVIGAAGSAGPSGEEEDATSNREVTTTSQPAAAPTSPPSSPTTATSLATTASPPPTTAQPASERIELAADGQQNTDPFELNGGSYTVDYDFGGECFYGASLERVDGSGFPEQLATGSGPVAGSSNVFSVDGGEYYVGMITGPPPGCPWTIVLTAR